MPELDKLYEKAHKYLQRKKFEAALETYQEILRYEPDCEEALSNLGDLSVKLNRSAEAFRYQVQLADDYVKQGDIPKGIAMFRRALKLSPHDVATLMKLADLLEMTQKNLEALDVYREALGLYRRAGLNAQILNCLTRIVRLDPNNLEEHLELADMSSHSRQVTVAVPALLRAAQLVRRAGDESRWGKLVEQAHALDPSDESASMGATELYLTRSNFDDAARSIEPILAKRPHDSEVLEFASNAYLGLGNFTAAQPLCRELYQANAKHAGLVLKLLEGQVRKGDVQQAFGTLKELKERLFEHGKRKEFLGILEKVYEADESNLDVLEFLSNLYNEMNKDDGLRRSLPRLFNLYLANGNYHKAADTLERILDVNPYAQGHSDRLADLAGHIDSTWYKNILSRVQPPSSGRATPATKAAATITIEQTESLDDLVVEGEMYHQYLLSAKLAETLDRIDRLFPGEDEKNQRVRDLYEAAGYTPKFKAPQAPVTTAHRNDSSSDESHQPLDDLRKISEITANIHRESTPQGVLQVAVTQIGQAVQPSRCWGALGLPDLPPVITAEYCSPLIAASDPAAAMKLFAHLVGLTTSSADGLLFQNVALVPLLSAVNSELQNLAICSLQVLPLMDKDAPAGLLLLEQCETPRAWSPGETLLLKAIATQVVIASNNTNLRRLVRSLAGTDPETGLLPRSAYLDCLLSEARRSKEQSQPLSVCLLEPENPRLLMKSLGDAGVRRFVLQVCKALAPALRQNDISIRYSPLSIAVVFADTALPQAGLAVEKVRRMLAQVRLKPAAATNFCAAVCEVQLGSDFDALDGVTEVINRLETSLERAHKEGGKRILISRFSG